MRTPPEIVDQIASYLPDATVMALANHGPAPLADSIRSHVDRARVTQSARRVATHAELQSVLQDTARLRLDHRSPPLIQAAMRLHDLPANSRQAFRAAFDSLPADRRSPELEALARIASHLDLGAAIEAGENVAAIARFHDITGAADLLALEWAAVEGPALRAVEGGEHIGVVMERQGLTAPHSRSRLETAAARGPAGEAVRNGMSVQSAAGRHGSTSAASLSGLELIAVEVALVAVRNGGNVQSIAQQMGIVQRTSIEQLEAAAVNGPAGDAVERGEDVESVIERHGIVGEDAQRNLRWSAL